MPPITDLCGECAKIPLDEYARGERGKDPSSLFLPGYSLGLFSRIQASQCPLCRLVHKAILWSRRTNWSDLEPILLRDEIRLRWAHENAPGLRSAFSCSQAEGVWLAFGSPRAGTVAVKNAYMLPKLPTELDVERVSRWIDHCTESHDCVISPHHTDFANVFPGLEVLRFVDVAQHCLVEKREPVRFVALSYIWGSVTNFRLTRANRPALMRPGAFENVGRALPPTIRDAIKLVQSLNLQYLWVDSLCLLQNDPEDLERGVRVMDQIYEHAWLTIIAAYGHDADAGLPSIENTYREPRDLLHQIKAGTYLGMLMDPGLRLKKAYYETRAWT
jgi:hypothetical protein